MVEHVSSIKSKLFKYNAEAVFSPDPESYFGFNPEFYLFNKNCACDMILKNKIYEMFLFWHFF